MLCAAVLALGDESVWGRPGSRAECAAADRLFPRTSCCLRLLQPVQRFSDNHLLEMTVPGTTSWDHDETTPAVSPTASAAVSRTPTLVDLPAHGLTAAFAGGDALQKKSSQDPNEGQDDDEHLSLNKDRHHDHRLHLPHPHLPPHPHQHLEQYLPPDNYETTAELSREKGEAQRGAGTAGTDPEKGPEEAAPVSAGPATSDYPDGGLEAWLCVPSTHSDTACC